jgi:hypothetical protein
LASARCRPQLHKDLVLAKPNYSFEKRQRELAKKKKKEEKDREKAARKAAGLAPLPDDPEDGDAPDDQAGPPR